VLTVSDPSCVGGVAPHVIIILGERVGDYSGVSHRDIVIVEFGFIGFCVLYSRIVTRLDLVCAVYPWLVDAAI
jgi:hypothetical protein